MPPVSNMRKSSTQTMTVVDPHSSSLQNSGANSGMQPRRTTASGRAIRANTTRPANYYARPFGSISIGADHDAEMADAANAQPPGFFPALQYFTDAITALPKEVMKQFTLMKEVEAKVYGPNGKLGEMIDVLMEQPVPTRRQTTNTGNGGPGAHGLLALTANNSTSGSANASLVNGVAGRQSAQPSLSGSTTGEEVMDTEEETRRRHQYHELRMLTGSLLANLDEKNVVLAEANRVLAQQETRLDSVMPHVNNELSEEAKWGSLTHWAYSDNKKSNKAPVSTGRGNVDKLADAANLLHEREILQARKDARTEANREKPKGKRTELADSDYDNDKPRKGPKGAKAKAAASAAATGLGISTNGEPATKRKKIADKGLGAPAMERTVSGTGKGAKGRETPRSTPAIEPPAKKTTKARPPPTQAKKKLPPSVQNSPMLASSPLASSFNPATMEPPPGARPQSARIRQNSSATNLRYERLQDEESNSRPTSAAGKINGNGDKANGRRKVQETTELHDEPTGDENTARQLKEASEKLKREDTDMRDAGIEDRLPGSRSGSNSRKNSGRQSKVGTPRTDSFPGGDVAMSRARSTRSKPNARDDSSSAEPTSQGPPIFNRHKRNMSNSHLVKQLAPFNKSPNLDRHRDNDDDMDEDLDSLEDRDLVEDEEPEHDAEKEPQLDRETRRSSTRRPVSRRNTANSTSHLRSSPVPISRESSAPASPPPTMTRSTGRTQAAIMHEAPPEDEIQPNEEEDEDSEHDPDDPNEPKYCYCNRGSYGEMIACDNENCPKEWFHLGCTELREAPGEEEKWYCRECRPLFGAVKVGRKSKAGRGRGG